MICQKNQNENSESLFFFLNLTFHLHFLLNLLLIVLLKFIDFHIILIVDQIAIMRILNCHFQLRS